MSKNSSMSKNSRTKLKLLSSVTAISLISVSVIGTHTTEVSANPFARLWSRIRNAAGNLTRYNPFKTSSKSFNLNKPSSNGKLSSPQVTTQQGFKQNFGDGSDVIITSNNQNESSTSNDKQNKSNLLWKVKRFLLLVVVLNLQKLVLEIQILHLNLMKVQQIQHIKQIG